MPLRLTMLVFWRHYTSDTRRRSRLEYRLTDALRCFFPNSKKFCTGRGSLEQVPLIRYKSLSEACSTRTKDDSSLGTALNSLYIFVWNLPSLARCTDAGTKFRLRVVRLTENPAVRQGLGMVGAAIRESFRWIQA
ncbi:hypothetical protein IG631_02390 [Alternaria alternata]|nr:hypothetical protein IG631_02390 [Alternaria alternata]